jgi:hypothetical protein
VAKPVLKLGGIELRNDSLIYRGESYRQTDFSFAFYFRDNNSTDNMYLGLNATDMPYEMVKAVFLKKGWYDFELWSGEYPIIQNNYEAVQNN